MILSPDEAREEPSGLHAPTWFATEQEYCTILVWAIIANKYKSILEIGTFLGHSTWWWNYAAEKTGGKVVTVDKNRQRKLDLPRVEQVEADSETFFSVCDDTYDFVYVDGWHGYDIAKHDIIQAKRVLNPGGMIAVHDTAYDSGDIVDVRRALDDAIKEIGGCWMHFSQGKGLSIGEF